MPNETTRVDCWYLDLKSVLVERLITCLSVQELGRADRFHFDSDREMFIKTRGALRFTLGQHLGRDPATLDILGGDGRKPELAGNPCFFNVSHSQNYSLIAISSVPVGVDIERVGDLSGWNRIARRFFNASEYEMLAALPKDVQMSVFFQFWTYKEAYLKGIGTGLSRSLASFSVPLHGGLVVDPLRPDTKNWFLHPITVADQYKASLAGECAKADILVHTQLT